MIAVTDEQRAMVGGGEPTLKRMAARAFADLLRRLPIWRLQELTGDHVEVLQAAAHEQALADFVVELFPLALLTDEQLAERIRGEAARLREVRASQRYWRARARRYGCEDEDRGAQAEGVLDGLADGEVECAFATRVARAERTRRGLARPSAIRTGRRRPSAAPANPAQQP